MKARVDDLVRELDERPVSVVGRGGGKDQGNDNDEEHEHRTSIVGGYEVLSAFRRPVYDAAQYPPLARALADAVDGGDFTGVLAGQFRRGAGTAAGLLCPRPGGPPPNASVVATRSELDAAHAIKCGDGDPATARMSAADLASYVRELARQSPTLGPYWASLRFECAGWTVRPGWRFTGPFSTPPPANTSNTPQLRISPAGGRMPVPLPFPLPQPQEQDKDRPEAPLLFVTARLDPVTPLRNAYAMAASHPGSAVLEVDAAGHCGSTVPSACTRRLLREYLALGSVPASGTRCPGEFDPWRSVSSSSSSLSDASWRGRRDVWERGPVDLYSTWPMPWA